MKKVKIAPSVLSADIVHLEEQIKLVEQNGASLLHVDVMDGHFVPNITFGPVMVSSLKKISQLPLDVHLMISRPEHYVEQFVKAGAKYITVHQETCPHLHRTIQLIKDQGVKAGISINPATPVYSIYPVLPEIDLVLVMSVNPGFGGQKFIKSSVEKIKMLATLKKSKSLGYEIEVDGGINKETAPIVVSAGGEILVAGNAIFGQENIGSACMELKTIAENTVEKL